MPMNCFPKGLLAIISESIAQVITTLPPLVNVATKIPSCFCAKVNTRPVLFFILSDNNLNYQIPVTKNSVLLFCAFPSSVVLSEIGFEAPYPLNESRLASTFFDIK